MKPRKVIIDKVPEAFRHLAKPFNDPNGLKYEIVFTKPEDVKTFLEAFNSEFENQAGESYIWLPSPWWFADGRQRRIENLASKRRR
jgi:hypothetical protein